jgi:hypothetical protein
VSKKEKAPPASKMQISMKEKKKAAEKKKRKPKTSYRQYDLKDIEQFALCDAMRYTYSEVYGIRLQTKSNTSQVYPSIRGGTEANRGEI